MSFCLKDRPEIAIRKESINKRYISLTQQEELEQIVICDSCGEKLEYKTYWAKEHRKKFPNHKIYTVKSRW